ncbi:MAG: hypothetical protein P8Z75_16660 [Gammaproteobacteria bacterium]|jgi:hypothetical protein
MKAIILLALSMFLIMVGAEASDQKWVSLYNVYVQSLRQPLHFDEFVAKNHSEFDQGFNKCASALFNKLWPVAEKQIDICNQHTNPGWKAQCLQNNPEATAALWVQSMYSRVNKGTAWCSTAYGYIQCYTEVQCVQTSGPAACNSVKEWTLTNFGPVIAPYFACPK